MTYRIFVFLMIFTGFYARSQNNYSGSFKISDDRRWYYFTLIDGKQIHAIHVTLLDSDRITEMYYPEKDLFSNIKASMIENKKDSLLQIFKKEFRGTLVSLNKNGRIKNVSYQVPNERYYQQGEGLRITFYPNGKPYAQFYLKNGYPYGNVLYFKRNGSLNKSLDLTTFLKGEMIRIRNPFDFRMRKTSIKVLIQ